MSALPLLHRLSNSSSSKTAQTRDPQGLSGRPIGLQQPESWNRPRPSSAILIHPGECSFNAHEERRSPSREMVAGGPSGRVENERADRGRQVPVLPVPHLRALTATETPATETPVVEKTPAEGPCLLAAGGYKASTGIDWVNQRTGMGIKAGN